MISLLLTILLEEMGYQVCASEATEDGAVAAAERTRPDLIIADMNLREGSGLGAIERISSIRRTPHIFATANVAAIRAGRPNAVMIQKPYQDAELQQAIDAAMGTAVAI
jgi:CheY-like chemotaxis protein